jgi:hypothetical protein
LVPDVLLACGIIFFSLAFWLGRNTVARQLWELLITFSLYPELFGTEFLEESGDEIARIVNQDVDSAEFRDGGLNRRVRILRASHVQLG